MGYGIKFVLVLGITLFSIGVQCDNIGITGSRHALSDEPVFDVTEFGARGNGMADGALAFMKTWQAACRVDGPVTLRVPLGRFKVGKVVFNGPCAANPLKVEIIGTIAQSAEPSAFSGNEPAMEFSGVSNVLLFGGGPIDGQGTSLWKYKKGEKDLLPISVMFSKSSSCTIDNIRFLNAKGVHFKVNRSQNILVKNLNIVALDESPNTDGIVISNSNNITVTNCSIGTGDDCIAVGDTNTDIFVSRITCGPGHGLSIGSLGKRLNEGDVLNIHVWNCTLFGTENGVRIKTYMGSNSLRASGIWFDNIVLNEVKNPLVIDQHYNSESLSASNVEISDVHFRNIRGTTNSSIPVSLRCSDAVPCQGIELRDINLFPSRFIRGPLISECINAELNIYAIFNPPGC